MIRRFLTIGLAALLMSSFVLTTAYATDELESQSTEDVLSDVEAVNNYLLEQGHPGLSEEAIAEMKETYVITDKSNWDILVEYVTLGQVPAGYKVEVTSAWVAVAEENVQLAVGPVKMTRADSLLAQNEWSNISAHLWITQGVYYSGSTGNMWAGTWVKTSNEYSVSIGGPRGSLANYRFTGGTGGRTDYRYFSCGTPSAGTYRFQIGGRMDYARGQLWVSRW